MRRGRVAAAAGAASKARETGDARSSHRNVRLLGGNCDEGAGKDAGSYKAPRTQQAYAQVACDDLPCLKLAPRLTRADDAGDADARGPDGRAHTRSRQGKFSTLSMQTSVVSAWMALLPSPPSIQSMAPSPAVSISS